ncbi:MAG: large subunit ribosomal protein L14e [Thermoproteota archaeon]|nr:large subunit ribosomal protein L14e [Thermoproteota archaeon]
MSALDVGRVCVKTEGRESGKKCVIVDVVDKSFVLITGPKDLTGVKRRRVNVRHIEPTEEIINITRGTSDKDIIVILGEVGKKSKK